MTMERDSLVARLGKLHEYDLVLDTNAYPKGPMAEGRDVYRVIGWEGADRGGLLLSEVEAREVRAAFRESSAAAALSRPEQVVKAAEGYRRVHDIAIAAYENAIPSDHRYSATALRKAVDAAISCLTTAAPLQADASAPASPAIGVQTVAEAAQFLLGRLRHFSDALSDSQSDDRWHFSVLPAMRMLEAALHPAPEAASAGNAAKLADLEFQAEIEATESARNFSPRTEVNHSYISHIAKVGFRAGIRAASITNAGSPVSPSASDTAPSPKGVSDGVQADSDGAMTEEEALGLPDAAGDDEMAFARTARQPVIGDERIFPNEPFGSHATAEERAASKEGA